MQCRRITALLLSLSMIVGSAAFTNPSSVNAAKKQVKFSAKKLTVQVGQSKKLKLKNDQKKVTWSVVSGKKCISLKAKKKTGVTVKGKRAGKAKVQAKIGKKKYTCIVTVKAAEDKTDPTQTGTPGDDKIVTLHYNDENANKIKKQIQGYSHYDDEDNLIIEKYVHVIVDEGVTSIEHQAFEFCDSLTNIEIPSSVTSIGIFAFFECSSLKNIKIPFSVTSIGDGAFFECISLKNIEIPSSVTSIGDDTFFECISLKNIKIPSSVTSIGDYAFECCISLKNIEIPNSVTSIGQRAFFDCRSLTGIQWRGNTYSNVDTFLTAFQVKYPK